MEAEGLRATVLYAISHRRVGATEVDTQDRIDRVGSGSPEHITRQLRVALAAILDHQEARRSLAAGQRQAIVWELGLEYLVFVWIINHLTGGYQQLRVHTLIRGEQVSVRQIDRLFLLVQQHTHGTLPRRRRDRVRREWAIGGMRVVRKLRVEEITAPFVPHEVRPNDQVLLLDRTFLHRVDLVDVRTLVTALARQSNLQQHLQVVDLERRIVCGRQRGADLLVGAVLVLLQELPDIVTEHLQTLDAEWQSEVGISLIALNLSLEQMQRIFIHRIRMRGRVRSGEDLRDLRGLRQKQRLRVEGHFVLLSRLAGGKDRPVIAEERCGMVEDHGERSDELIDRRDIVHGIILRQFLRQFLQPDLQFMVDIGEVLVI